MRSGAGGDETSRVAARPNQARLSRAFWRGSTVAVLVTTCGALGVFLVGALAVQIRADLDIGVSGIGILVGIYFAVSALTSWIAGRTVERVGAERSMRFAVLLAAVALTIASLSPQWLWLALAMAVTGFANAGGQAGANLFIARFLHPSRQALAFGIKQSGIPTATLLGGLAVPAVALTIGWRWAFALGAAFALILSASIPGRDRSDGSERRVVARVGGERVPSLVILAVAGALGSAAANSLGAFFVDSTVSVGIGAGTAGLVYAAGSVVGLTSRVYTGWAADRRSSGRLLWVSGLLLAGGAGYALMAAQVRWLLLPATLLCFAGGWGWPGLFNFAVVARNPAAPAEATGITQTGNFAGGVTGPLLFGFVAEHASYAAAWSGAAIFAVGAAAGIWVGRRMLIKVLAATGSEDELPA